MTAAAWRRATVPGPARRGLLRWVAVLIVSVGLLLGLAGSAASTPERAPALLPMDPNSETNVRFTPGCFFVPQTATGSQWVSYCPNASPLPTNDFIRLRDANGNHTHREDMLPGVLPAPNQPEEFFKLSYLQDAWYGDCGKNEVAKFMQWCLDWKGKFPAGRLPNRVPDSPASFWENGNGEPGVSRPCEFLAAAAGTTVGCIDPRDSTPCPPERFPPRSQLLRTCESQNDEVMKHFGWPQQTSASSNCQFTGGFCDYAPDQPVTTAGTEDEQFLEEPIKWTETHLAEAVGQVITWWILAPEPVIEDNKDTGINAKQNVDFLIRHTNAITLTIVIISIIIAAIRMALSRKVEHAREVVKSVVVLVLISGLSVLVINYLVKVSSAYSTWILVRGLDPNAKGDPTREQGQRAATNAVEAFTGGLTGMNFFLFLLLALCLMAGGIVQWVYMIARIPVVTILAGTLPLAAAATNTAVGKSWMTKHLTYLAAFILVKPAAVTVFVAAARMWAPTGGGPLSAEAQFRGAVILLLMSLLLPALIRIIFPIATPATGGQGAATAMVGGVLAGGARLVRRG
ncbi:MAG: hypothetical protein HOV68_33880 [Streptomycetaceae bacterium]|nr:hypothetical protein [Streptomycetaceae bacterium]